MTESKLYLESIMKGTEKEMAVEFETFWTCEHGAVHLSGQTPLQTGYPITALGNKGQHSNRTRGMACTRICTNPKCRTKTIKLYQQFIKRIMLHTSKTETQKEKERVVENKDKLTILATTWWKCNHGTVRVHGTEIYPDGLIRRDGRPISPCTSQTCATAAKEAYSRLTRENPATNIPPSDRIKETSVNNATNYFYSQVRTKEPSQKCEQWLNESTNWNTEFSTGIKCINQKIHSNWLSHRMWRVPTSNLQTGLTDTYGGANEFLPTNKDTKELHTTQQTKQMPFADGKATETAPLHPTVRKKGTKQPPADNENQYQEGNGQKKEVPHNNKVLYFYSGTKGPLRSLSNWYTHERPWNFEINSTNGYLWLSEWRTPGQKRQQIRDRPFPHPHTKRSAWVWNAETAIMLGKASFQGDQEIWEKLSKTHLNKDPAYAKRLGRQIFWGTTELEKQETEKAWSNTRPLLAESVIQQKYESTPTIQKILMDTGTNTLAEESTKDNIWGVGLERGDNRKQTPKLWPAAPDGAKCNLLGRCLERTRKILQKGHLLPKPQIVTQSLLLLDSTDPETLQELREELPTLVIQQDTTISEVTESIEPIEALWENGGTPSDRPENDEDETSVHCQHTEPTIWNPQHTRIQGKGKVESDTSSTKHTDDKQATKSLTPTEEVKPNLDLTDNSQKVKEGTGKTTEIGPQSQTDCAPQQEVSETATLLLNLNKGEQKYLQKLVKKKNEKPELIQPPVMTKMTTQEVLDETDQSHTAAILEDERTADDDSMAGVLDFTGYQLIEAQSYDEFTPANMRSNPSNLYLYPEITAPRGNDMLPKCSDVYYKGLPLSIRCRRLPNTMGIPVAHHDGTPFRDDDDIKTTKAKISKAMKRAIVRGRRARITQIIIPPEGKFDLYQDFGKQAPTCAAALEAQLRNLRMAAKNYQPKQTTASEPWHGPNDYRTVRGPALPDEIEMDLNLLEQSEAWNPMEAWGRTNSTEHESEHTLDHIDASKLNLFATNTTTTTNKKTTSYPSKDLPTDEQRGAYGHLRALDCQGNPTEGIIHACVDGGSTGLPNSLTGFMDIRCALALGLRIDTSRKHRIATAGGESNNSHLSYGVVRANMRLETHNMGWTDYIVTTLPGSTGAIIGSNECERHNIDAVFSKLRAPNGPLLVFSYEGTAGTKDEGKIIEHRVPARKRPLVCPLKASIIDVPDQLATQEMERTLLIQEMYDYVSPQSEQTFPMNPAMTGIVTDMQQQEEAILLHMRSELETEKLYIQQEDGSRQDLTFEFLPEADIDLMVSEIESNASSKDSTEDQGIQEDVVYLLFTPTKEDNDDKQTSKQEDEETPETKEEAAARLVDTILEKHNCRPESNVREDYGICPKTVEQLKLLEPLALAAYLRWVKFWEQPGRCGCEAEMNATNASRAPHMVVKNELKPECKDTTWMHKSYYGESMKKVVQTYVTKCLAKGWIRPASDTRYLSRLVLVRKPGHADPITGKMSEPTFRCCIDLRTHNSVTRPIKMQLTSVESIFANLPNEARYVHVVDYASGFFSVLLDDSKENGPSSQDLCSFACHAGNFSWVALSMGATQSPSAFCTAVATFLNSMGLCAGDLSLKDTKMTPEGIEMRRIFSSKTEEYGDWEYKDDELHTPEMDKWFVQAYLDDNVFTSLDLRGGERRCWMLAWACTSGKFWLNGEKCLILRKAADLLGMTIACIDGQCRIYGQRSRVAAMLELPVPRNKKALISCLAAMGWHRNHVQNFQREAAPLFKLSGKAFDMKRDWTEEHTSCWENIKLGIAKSMVRFPPNPAYAKILVTDASKAGLGATCYQVHPVTGDLQPLGCASRALLTTAEANLPPADIEENGLAFGLTAFSSFLLGNRFTICIRSDNRNLTTLQLRDKTGLINQRMSTLLRTFSKFSFQIVWMDGEAPGMATSDSLSRNVPTNASEFGIFEGGTRLMPYGTGLMTEAPGMAIGEKHPTVTSDLTEEVVSAETRNKLRIKNAAINWEGPQHEIDTYYHEDKLPRFDPYGAEAGHTHHDPRLARTKPAEKEEKILLALQIEDEDITELVPQFQMVDKKQVDSWKQKHHTMYKQPVKSTYIFNKSVGDSTNDEQINMEYLGPNKQPNSPFGGDCMGIHTECASLSNEPMMIAHAMKNITYKGFEKQLVDRCNGVANAEAMRATNSHNKMHRMEKGLLQRQVLGSKDLYLWVIVIPEYEVVIQQQITAFYHKASCHMNGTTLYTIIRDKYVWDSQLATIQRQCQKCEECIKLKMGNHKDYGRPSTHIAPPIPMANIAADIFSMPPTTDGYDAILLIICLFSKWSMMIAIKSKGLISPELRKAYPAFADNKDVWDASKLATKCYTKFFSIFGLPTTFRTDGQASLWRDVWPIMMKLCGCQALVGTAYNSTSNSVCERKIKSMRGFFAATMKRRGAHTWKRSMHMVQSCANSFPSTDSGVSPDELLMAYRPKRIYDMLHIAPSMPDGDLKLLIEDREEFIRTMKRHHIDNTQKAADRSIQRQAKRFRDLPVEWGDPNNAKTFWVMLKASAFNKASDYKAGSRHKQLHAGAEGYFRVIKINDNGASFTIEKPSWMKRRISPSFRINAIRHITDTHPDPRQQLKTMAEKDSDFDSEDEVYEIEALLHRRYNKSRDEYEYNIRWKDHGDEECTYESEFSINAKRLIESYDKDTPRGSVLGDRPTDAERYLIKQQAQKGKIAEDTKIADGKAKQDTARNDRRRLQTQSTTGSTLEGSDTSHEIPITDEQINQTAQAFNKANPDEAGQVQANPDKTRQVQANPDEVQANPDKTRQVQANPDKTGQKTKPTRKSLRLSSATIDKKGPKISNRLLLLTEEICPMQHLQAINIHLYNTEWQNRAEYTKFVKELNYVKSQFDPDCLQFFDQDHDMVDYVIPSQNFGTSQTEQQQRTENPKTQNLEDTMTTTITSQHLLHQVTHRMENFRPPTHRMENFLRQSVEAARAQLDPNAPSSCDLVNRKEPNSETDRQTDNIDLLKQSGTPIAGSPEWTLNQLRLGVNPEPTKDVRWDFITANKAKNLEKDPLTWTPLFTTLFPEEENKKLSVTEINVYCQSKTIAPDLQLLNQHPILIPSVVQQGIELQTISWYDTRTVNNSPRTLFIFGDTFDPTEESGQSVIRDCSNSIGIPTKLQIKTKINGGNLSYMTDGNEQNYKNNCENIYIAIITIFNRLRIHAMEYDILCLPATGIGTGRAKMAEKSPRTYRYLQDQLDRIRYELGSTNKQTKTQQINTTTPAKVHSPLSTPTRGKANY